MANEDYFTSTVDGAMGFERMRARKENSDYIPDDPGEVVEEDGSWWDELLERRKKMFGI